LKPGVDVVEDGLFSGGDEKAEPRTFRVERVESRKDGSSRVYVRLTWGNPPDKPLIWYVSAVVVRENGRLAVDDVLYLKTKTGDVESSLAKTLSSGCDGGHWVGRPG
jgi:hypothetical protein